MPWLPSYGQGLAGWGEPPRLEGGHVEGIAAALLKQRQLQQEQLQKIPSQIGEIMQQQQQDKIAQTMLGSGGLNQDLISKMQAQGIRPKDIYAAVSQESQDQEDAVNQEQQQRLNEAKIAALTNRSTQGPAGKIWSPELGGWVTPYQKSLYDARTTKADPEAQLMNKHGLSADDLLNPDNAVFGGYDKAGNFIPGPGGYVSVKGQGMPSGEFRSWVSKLQQKGYGNTLPDEPNNLTGQSSGQTVTAPSGTPGGTIQSAGTEARVRVQDPNGQIGTLPQSQLADALANGYKQL
jgi:hypothetical protein